VSNRLCEIPSESSQLVLAQILQHSISQKSVQWQPFCVDKHDEPVLFQIVFLMRLKIWDNDEGFKMEYKGQVINGSRII
jgi:hypothetical protein